MKKVVSILISMAMFIMFASCGLNEASVEENTDNEAASSDASFLKDVEDALTVNDYENIYYEDLEEKPGETLVKDAVTQTISTVKAYVNGDEDKVIEGFNLELAKTITSSIEEETDEDIRSDYEEFFEDKFDFEEGYADLSVIGANIEKIEICEYNETVCSSDAKQSNLGTYYLLRMKIYLDSNPSALIDVTAYTDIDNNISVYSCIIESLEKAEIEEPVRIFWNAYENCDGKKLELAYPNFINEMREEKIGNEYSSVAEYYEEDLRETLDWFEGEYGDNIKIELEFKEQKALTEDRLEEFEERISNAYGVSVNIEQGYKMKVEIIVSGSDGDDSTTEFMYVCNIDGKWCVKLSSYC